MASGKALTGRNCPAGATFPQRCLGNSVASYRVPAWGPVGCARPCRCNRLDHRSCVVAQAGRIAARLDRPDATPDLISEHRDATVGRAEMFEAVDGNQPLRYLCLKIARPPLAFLASVGGVRSNWPSCPSASIAKASEIADCVNPRDAAGSGVASKHAVGEAQNVGAIPAAAIWAMMIVIIISTGSLKTKQDINAPALIRQVAAQTRLGSPAPCSSSARRSPRLHGRGRRRSRK